MVTVLYLIRHGETEGAEKRRYKGSIDVPLSENGIRQMELLSAYIPNPLKAVYCSDLQRAIKSAELIAKPHSLNPIIVPSLRERNFGIWEGMSFDEIQLKYPDEFKAWAGNPLQFSPMGGESTFAMSERVLNSLEEIIRNHEGEHVAIVAHGGVNRIIICHLLGIPLENIFRIDQDYGALNIIEFWGKYPVVKLINGIVYS
ncbi:MAG: alpha-ribazole phosphatase [Nitrospira sp.]|nr:alpha-ribazole phosphatase [Nitrospira sp.]